MARYEFVEGTSSKFWDVTLDDKNVTVTFGKIGTSGQTQTKTFATPELAKKEHDKLVAEKTKKGYKLAGGASSSAATAAKPPTKPSKPAATAAAFRKDYYVYNEATGLLVTSKRMGGKGLEGSGDEWVKAVKRGDMIPLELYQDDPFIMRVVIGDLLPQEDEEWTGRLDWKLRVPDGNLVVCGGSEYVMEEFEDEEEHSLAEYVKHIKIPRGDYKATIFMYMPGVNGTPCLRAAKGGDEPEPLGEWFRRTRPKEKFPEWLQNECISDPAEDTDHEDEWEGKKPVKDPNRGYVEFLLQLTPMAADEKVEMPKADDGWFSTPSRCRVPERIPLRIIADNPEGLVTEEERKAKRPKHGHLILQLTEKFKRTPIKGGNIEVPLERLQQLYRIPWFCHVWAIPQIKILLPADAKYELIPGGEYTYVNAVPNGFDVSFETGGSQSKCIYLIKALGERMKGLPDGTEVELDTCYNDEREMKKPVPIGLHRYKGTVRNGVLHVTECFPPVEASTLKDVLALSAQVENEKEIDCGDEAVADAVLKVLKKHLFFSDNPAVKKGSTGITLTKSEPLMLNFVATEVFMRKYKAKFAALDLLSDDDDDDDDDDEDDEEMDLAAALGGGAAKQPNLPPKGEVLLQGADKRVTYLSDATKMVDAVAKRIADIEKEILPLGFKLVADIVVNAMEQAVIRGYAQQGGSAWGALIANVHGGGLFEFVGRFEMDASLTVTRNQMASDELYRNAFKSARTSGSIADMWKEFQRRSAHLATQFGAPVKLKATAKGLAEDVEFSIKRQTADKAASGLELLLKGDDTRRHYSYDARRIDATAPAAFDRADKEMAELGYKPVGDVVSTFFSKLANRGYAKPGGNTWVLFRAEACSQPKVSGYWELSTVFEKGAQLETTRAAMSKDEPKRKIFRILDANPDPAVLLKKHEKRIPELEKKYGTAMPVNADMKSLAAAIEASFVRLMG